MNTNNKLGIYIHIPFCRQKCVYCDFYSLPCQSEQEQEQAIEEYLSALKEHFKLMSEKASDRTVDTVFFGGGTPSLLSGKQIYDILNRLSKSYNLSSDAEITIEANPATFDAAKLRDYRHSGINRLSIGMQSANDNELKLLGRIHSSEQLENAFDAATHANFDNINVDLMYGIPSQTLSSFENTLNTAASLHPSHISVYGLQLEEGTPLFKNQKNYSFPTDDDEKAMGRLALEILEKAGYHRYEISNYSLPDRECRHNLRYWYGEEYLGFGAAAHSFFNGMRYHSPYNTQKYITAVKSQNFHNLELDCNTIDKNEAIEEYIILRMRLTEGISGTEFEDKFNSSFSVYEKKILPFVKSGHIEYTNERYHFTAEGFDVSNYILSSII